MAIRETVAPHQLDAVQVCHVCRTPLQRDEHGCVRYWCAVIPHPTQPGWLLTVKLCPHCRAQQERDSR